MGNRIRELRHAKKLTMKQLGEELGVAESTISQYETGKRQPDNETLLRLGEYFDVTVGYILGAETEKAPTQEDERNDEVAALLEFYRSRTDDCRMLFSVAKSATSEDIKAAAALIEALRRKEGR